MAWWDFFKVFQYAFTEDPLTRRNNRYLTGAGVSQVDAIPDIRSGTEGTLSNSGSSSVRLRDTNDFVDLSTVTNRIHRYKEYERLRNMPEIEMAMTVFADESCFAGNTRICTPSGYKTLKELSEAGDDKFLVYCYDFEKQDYTLGWAHSARKTRTAMTVRVILDNGDSFVCTPDHRVLSSKASWVEAGDLTTGDELMPFYRVPANSDLNDCRTNQFPRIFTHNQGWIHERQFIDQWRTGSTPEDLVIINRYCKMISEGLFMDDVRKLTGNESITIIGRLKKNGFTPKELRWLGKKSKSRRVVAVLPHKEIDVYDITVETHHNFATEWGIAHNCQRDDEGRVFKIITKNKQIKEELEFLFFHRKMLNFDQKRVWNLAKLLFVFGDFFYEIVINPDNPSEGVYNLVPLPPDSMYRIETTKGKLLEFQQSKEGPDYQSLARVDVTQATDMDLQQATAIRFAPEQVVHIRIGDDRKTFYPYGVSLIEAARGPAHQLRLMEDAMVVYRLCLVGDTRIRTKEGYKYIKDLAIGDNVFSYDFEKECTSARVINFVNNGIKDVYKVKSKHIEITGTATHPILVNRNGIIQYVDIQDLIVGKDKVINVTRDEEKLVEIPKIPEEKWAKLSSPQRTAFRNSIYENKSELIRKCVFTENRVKQFLYSEGKALPYDVAKNICEVFDLDPEQLVITNKGQTNSERINLPEFVDEEFARLFGFLIGDGSIRKNQYQLCFACGTDGDQNRYYATILEKYFGRVKFSPDKRRKNKKLGSFVVNSREACRIFMKMGYVHGAKNKRIPDWVFTASKEIRRAFVEGLSNADGCERRTEAGTWFSTIELSNKRLVEDIKEIWSSIGTCSGKLVHRKRKGGHEVEKGRKMPSTECYSVTLSERALPEYENVLSVKHIGKEEVYDITVDNELHNFIANSTCVHNTRAPERRVFYIDVQQLPPYKAEAFVDRMKDQFKKKKVPSAGRLSGASSVEERWQAPAADEDFWIPIRPNANTRVETLPGAQNLGEIDDALYFRNKLFTALSFPRNYFNNEDAASTRIALSAQDVKFARMIERLQSHIEDALWEICDRHLKLLGYPEEVYDDLVIKMTPPSDWRELTRAEIVTNRLNNASNLKGSQLMSDFDILTKWMKYDEEETKKMLARLKIQKLEDLKLQIVAQNPTLLGVGLPGVEETEIGTEPGGPNPMLGAEGLPAAPESAGAGAAPPPAGASGLPQGGGTEPPLLPPGTAGMRKYMSDGEEQNTTPVSGSGNVIPTASDDDIKKYNLDIKDFEKEMDEEEIDASEA